MSISWQKWLVMGLLALFSLILGLLPYFIVKSKGQGQRAMKSLKFNIFVSFLSCFGAGALLSTALIHMLPEVQHGLQDLDIWTDLPNTTDFPLAEVIVICGFILVYLVEEVAHAIMQDDGHHHVHSHHDTMAKHGAITHNITVPDCTHHGDENAINMNNNELSNLQRFGKYESNSNNVEEVCQPQDTETGSVIRSLLAVIALSMHEVMEGLAIGIEDTEDVWYMFGGIASHKLVLSFCMGMELICSRAKLVTYFGSVIFFGLISSVGILIGSLIDEDESANTLGINIIRGIAIGTILYIVFLEILSRERSRKEQEPFQGRWKLLIGFIQLFAFTCGIIALGSLFISNHHTHGDDHDHDHDHEDDHDHDHDHFRNFKIIKNVIM